MSNNLTMTLLLIFGIVIASIIFLIIIVKSKRDLVGKIKRGNTEATIEVTQRKDDKKETKESNKSSDTKVAISQANEDEFDLDKLSLHRFFTTILPQYTSENYIFNLYNETLRIGIIKDSEEIAQFKKILASKYLHLCLFKVLGENVRKWITDLVEELSRTKNYNKIPSNFYVISQYITQYKTEAYKEGKSMEFKFQNKIFYGIPTKFMTRFNNWSDNNMIRVYNMISDVLYSTQNNWFAKTIELLDLFEVIFMMLHDQMDATLIILNGEIANFLEKIKEDNYESI
jgi:hypothetical protein